MCTVSRREVLAQAGKLGGVLSLAALEEEARARQGQVNKVDPLAEGVYFHEGDIAGHGHCNNGWVILEDYVLVIDANFPSGAMEILPKIRALTPKPIRFAFDTHHHGDHAYGNQVWVENGATPLAHTGVAEEMKRYEPARWNDTAKGRPDVAASKLKPPSLLFPKELYFDDGKRRVELVHLGVAHTHGDAFAWLPRERILFSGDACVNGPFNFVGDGSVEQWIRTLAEAKKLGARVLCPGHGPRGAGGVIDDQRAFFMALRDAVGRLVHERKTAAEVRGAVPQIAAAIKANAQTARYVDDRGIVAQAEKVYTELTGGRFPMAAESTHARIAHARQHGHAAA